MNAYVSFLFRLKMYIMFMKYRVNVKLLFRIFLVQDFFHQN